MEASDTISFNAPVRLPDGRLKLIGSKMSREVFDNEEFRTTLLQAALRKYGIQLPGIVPLVRLNEEGTEYSLPEYPALHDA